MKRRWRWALGTATLVVLVFAVFAWVRVCEVERTLAHSRSTVDRLSGEAEALDPRRPTLGVPRAGGNAWDIYTEVLADLAAAEDGDWRQRVRSIRSCGCEKDCRTKVDEAAEMRGPFLERLRSGASAPTCRPVLERFTPGREDILDGSNAVDDVVSLALRHRLLGGEVDAAIDLCLLRWAVGYDFARHTGSLPLAIGESLARASTEDLRRILACHPVGGATLERLAEGLEVLRAVAPDVESTLLVEELGIRRILNAMAGNFSLIKHAMYPIFSDALASLPAELQELETTYGRMPGHAAFESLKQRGDEHLSPLLRLFLFGGRHALRGHSWCMSLHDLTRIAVALARYREEHGEMPTTLEALVPEFLEAIPTCGYSGEAFRYDGERVWSVGSDGDQRAEVPESADDARSEGDLVFALYTPDFERFPWRAEVDATTRERIEAALDGLPDADADAALEELAAIDVGAASRLVSEFRRIDEEQGLGTEEGVRRAALVDAALRRLDGTMECTWCDLEGITDPASARQVALRWNGWWRSGLWNADPQPPCTD